MKIYMWPCGTWCEDDELHQMTHKSDDYAVVIVPDDAECVDTYLKMNYPELIN